VPESTDRATSRRYRGDTAEMLLSWRCHMPRPNQALCRVREVAFCHTFIAQGQTSRFIAPSWHHPSSCRLRHHRHRRHRRRRRPPWPCAPPATSERARERERDQTHTQKTHRYHTHTPHTIPRHFAKSEEILSQKPFCPITIHTPCVLRASVLVQPPRHLAPLPPRKLHARHYFSFFPCAPCRFAVQCRACVYVCVHDAHTEDHCRRTRCANGGPTFVACAKIQAV
jgi:hypothetical protein